jgi:hypothetical protein
VYHHAHLYLAFFIIAILEIWSGILSNDWRCWAPFHAYWGFIYIYVYMYIWRNI